MTLHDRIASLPKDEYKAAQARYQQAKQRGASHEEALDAACSSTSRAVSASTVPTTESSGVAAAIAMGRKHAAAAEEEANKYRWQKSTPASQAAADAAQEKVAGLPRGSIAKHREALRQQMTRGLMGVSPDKPEDKGAKFAWPIIVRGK